MKIYQVDAFASSVFKGNPAAICPLEEFPADNLMQDIAMENNLAETAFIVRNKEGYDIRWFTPTVEVDLCGHATLASAHVIFEFLKHQGEEIKFHSPRSGQLKVYRNGLGLTLDFPTDQLASVELSAGLTGVFNHRPKEILKGKADYMFVYDSESQIRTIVPRFDAIGKLDCRGVIVTAPGLKVDFVSRWFGPQSGIDEDAVTGSAHTTLTAFWSKRLGKKELSALQLSRRGGELRCKDLGDRIHISGEAKTYLVGEIFVG